VEPDAVAEVWLGRRSERLRLRGYEGVLLDVILHDVILHDTLLRLFRMAAGMTPLSNPILWPRY
jgi:hypothetical protein